MGIHLKKLFKILRLLKLYNKILLNFPIIIIKFRSKNYSNIHNGGTMKYLKIFLTIFLLFSFSSISNAQLFQIGAGGGLTQILAPDYYTNSVQDGGLGFSTEWNAGVIAKLGLPLIPITPRGYFLYHSLSGNGESVTSNQNIDFTQSISEIGLGVQYNFIPLPAGFDPYIALDIAYNNFSSLDSSGTEIPDTKFSRFGGGIGIGTEITIIPILDFDVFASYKMFNLVGKEEDEESITAFTFDVFILFSFL